MANLVRNPYLHRSMIRTAGCLCCRGRELARLAACIAAAPPPSVPRGMALVEVPSASTPLPLAPHFALFWDVGRHAASAGQADNITAIAVRVTGAWEVCA